MMDHGICDHESVKWGLMPTRRVPGEALRAAARNIDEALTGSFVANDVSRAMLLGAIGSQNAQKTCKMIQ